MLPFRTLRRFALPLILASAVTLPAQIVTDSDLPEKPRLEIDSEVENGLQLTWFGREGFSYFLQTTTDLVSEPWQYLPVIETGQDAELEYGLIAPSPRFFARIVLSEQTAANPMTADFDGDGITNIDELNRMIDPLANRDDDNDGHPDDWERYYFNDTTKTNDAFSDQDTDGLSDYEEVMRGTDPQLPDTDGDGVLDGADGWPLHDFITTAPLPETRFAVIPLRDLGWPATAWTLEGGLDDRGVVHGKDDQDYVSFDLATGALHRITRDTFIATAPPPPWVPSPYSIDIGPIGKNGHVAFDFYLYYSPSWTNAGRISPAGIASAITLPPAQWPMLNMSGWPKFVNANGDVGMLEFALSDGYPVEVRVAIYDVSGNRTQLSSFKATSTNPVVGVFDQSVIGGHFLPSDMNASGIMVGTWTNRGDAVSGYVNFENIREGMIYSDGNVLLKDIETRWSRILDGDGQGIPPIAFGSDSGGSHLLWAHEGPTGAWEYETTKVWHRSTRQEIHVSTSNYYNNRLEFVDNYADRIVRNGESHRLADLIPSGWSLSANYGGPAARGLDKHGAILAEAKRTIDAAGLPIPPSSQVAEPVLLVPFDVVRKDEDGDYVSFTDIPVMRAGDGVGRGPATSSITASPIFTIEAYEPLNPQIAETLVITIDDQAVLLTETGVDSSIFENSAGSIRIEVISPITFVEEANDSFAVLYTNTTAGVSNETVSLVETGDPGVFRSLHFSMWVTMDPGQPGTIDFSVSNSEVGMTLSGSLTETIPNTGIYGDPAKLILGQNAGSFLPTQIDTIEVEATFTNLMAHGVTLRLGETTADSLVFTNVESDTVTFADESPRAPSETVEVFRVRRYSAQTGNTMQMIVKTDSEEKEITLTRTTGSEFLSEAMIAVMAGDDAASIPDGALYTQIKVSTDAHFSTKEIRFYEPGLDHSFGEYNGLRSAYVAHSFSTDPKKKIEKAAGDLFVDEWKEAMPNKLGWSLTDGSADYSSSKSRFLAVLPESGFLAWFGHGDYREEPYAFVGLDMFRPAGVKSGPATRVTGPEMASGLNYDFVLLNACGSATPGNTASEELIAKFNSKVLIGWDAPANLYAAASFAQNLLKECDKNQKINSASANAWRNVKDILKIMSPGKPRMVWRSDMTELDKADFRIDKK